MDLDQQEFKISKAQILPFDILISEKNNTELDTNRFISNSFRINFAREEKTLSVRFCGLKDRDEVSFVNFLEETKNLHIKDMFKLYQVSITDFQNQVVNPVLDALYRILVLKYNVVKDDFDGNDLQQKIVVLLTTYQCFLQKEKIYENLASHKTAGHLFKDRIYPSIFSDTGVIFN